MIIAKLSDKRIFDIAVSDDGKTIEFMEGCDNHFYYRLDKKEMLQLSDEIKLIGERMKE